MRTGPQPTERTVQAASATIEATLASPDVAAAIARLAPAEKEQLGVALDRMRRKTAYVAALGAQGAGKSSLLNSLLFTRRVLPIGEGATTNVVCHVQSAGETAERAEVTMRDGRVIPQPLDLASLEPYMREAGNPLNEKGVRFVTCFTRSELLANNTSFVDTPGLASLNKLDDATTMSFVADVALGVFVLRTTPPLTQGEGEFLRDIWPSCPAYVFVQNVWGESRAQIDEARDHNIRALEEIARESKDDRPITLLTVDIHAALEGATNDDPDRVERSGLNHLKSVLRRSIQRDGQRLEVSKRGRQIAEYLRSATQAGQVELAALRHSGDVERYLERLGEQEEELRTLQARLPARRKTFLDQCKDHLEGFRRDLGREMRGVRDRFTYDIDRYQGASGVDTAYLAAQKQVIAREVEAFHKGFRETCAWYMSESASDLEVIKRALQVDVDDVSSPVADVSDTRLLEGMGRGVVRASGVALSTFTVMSAGAFVGGAAGGAGAAAGLAAAFAAVPGPGWVVAGAALAAGGVMKFVARNKRRTKLLEEFERVEREMEGEVAERVSTEAVRARDKIEAEVQKEQLAAVQGQKTVIERVRVALTSTQETKGATEVTLRRMIVVLETAIEEIEGALQRVQ